MTYPASFVNAETFVGRPLTLTYSTYDALSAIDAVPIIRGADIFPANELVAVPVTVVWNLQDAMKAKQERRMELAALPY